MTTLLGGERNRPRFDDARILNAVTTRRISLVSYVILKYNNFSNRLCNGKILP